MKKIGYCRVSTVDQNPERQKEGLKKYGIDKWFEESVSGKSLERPKLQEMIDYVREGDIVYVHDFSRLARNTRDLLSLVELFEKKGVSLVSSKEAFDTSTPTGKLMITMIGAINEFERQIMLERQREGIAIAKASGKYKGRQEKEIDKEKFGQLYEQYMTRKINKTEFAKKMGVSRTTLYKHLSNINLLNVYNEMKADDKEKPLQN